MKKEWYISFHGGEDASTLNNIHVYSAAGKWLRKALNKSSLPQKVSLRELRGFTIDPDGNLFVVNAFKDFSQVLRFRGKLNTQEQHDFMDVFVQYDAATNPGLKHPFNAVFDSAGNLYVTSQDTNVTLRYHGPKTKDGVPAAAMPLPLSLHGLAGSGLYPGTFCASAKQVPHGLVVVREAVFVGSLLYVADRDADCVKKYDTATGEYRGEIGARGVMDKPIHLAVKDGTMYVGNRGNESVVKCDLRTETVAPFIPPQSGGLKNPAGLAFGNDGYFYVASRDTREILRYQIADGKPDSRPFITGLADDPEFIEPMPADRASA